MSAFGEDFGQKVDLTASIRNILRNYPEGTAVLKELVQNADDAGARRVVFVLDHRNHEPHKLADAALHPFQGPALHAYNDATFTAEDFKSIQRIGDSLKKSEESQSKIGRFGIGFNAVYHWTDLPSFVSANYLVMLDPQARFLPNVNPSNPGKIVDWVKNKALVTQYADQFKPYSGSENFLVTDWSKPFSGTLFRLPLRTPEQAETSMLSKRALSTVDAVQLLDALQVEASAMLLFLKNVEAIEIREYLQDETSSRLRFAANIKNIDKPLRQKRAFISDFRSHLPKLQSNPSHSTSADYTLAIECVNSIEKEQKIYAHQPIIYTESWVICNQLGGLSANKIAMDKDNALLRLIPWGGVAACIDCTDSSIGENSSRDGLAYCFLPLPVKTALPVMTNGFFELSSNRRDIWQGGADQTGDGRTRALWNVSLMKDVIAPSYIRLLLQLKTIIGFTETYQKMWPSIRTASPWKDLVESVLSLSQSQLLLQVNGFENSTSANAKSPIWVKCSEAILLPKVYQKYQLDPVDQSQLLNFLKMCSAPVVVCIPTLRDTLEESKTCPIVAFPSLVRQLLRSHNTSLILQKLHCRFLMKYCILDLHSDDVQSFTELNLLKVVPLTNNDVAAIAVYNQREVSAINELISMGFNATDALAALSASKFDVGTACDLITSDQFSKVKTNAKILILAGEEELNVFTSNSSTMIDRDALDPLSIEFLSSASLQRMSNVRNFQASLVVDLIKQLLPPAAINGSNYFDSSKLSGEEKILFDRFINSFWNYSRTKPDVVSAIVLGPPLVPIANDSSCYSLSRVSNLIGSTKGDTVLPQDLLEVMVTIGAHVVNSSLLQNAIAMPSVFWENVHSPSRSGVISAVEYALRSNKNITGNLTDDQKDNLRKYLVISEPIKRISDEEATTIRQLEIFPIYTADNQRRFTSLEVKLNRSIVGKRVALLSTMDGLQPEVLGASVNFHFLLYSTAQEKAFYDYLNIFTVSRGDYFIQEVIPNLKSLYANYPEQTVATLLNMLESLSSLNRDNTRFIQQLQQSSFVPTVSPQETVEFKIPSEVFDPSVPQMSDLLGGEFFPMSSFCREDYLVFLRSVGLKTVLDWPALITCAQSIENLPEISREESQTKLARANNLLKYLESNIDRLTGKEKKQKAAESSFSLLGLFFAGDKPGDKHISLQEIDSYLESLQYISWFPCLVEPPNRCMPWHAPAKGKLSILASPVVVSPLSEAWLCSATRRIALSDVSSSLLRKSLGFGNPHSIQTIAMQLKELATKFRDYLSSTDLVDSELQNLRVVVTGLIPQLYERLNSAPQDRYELIVSILESCSWIWVGDDFVPPLKVAINAGVNAAPFLYQLPQDLHVFTNLFSLFKVKQNFNYIDYIAALRSMAETTGAVSQEISDSQPLSVTHLDMAISLVTLLSTEGADSLARHTIYVPDSVGKLHPSTKLVNDDVPWLSGPQYLSVRSDCKFIHPNISSRVAEKLGVQSLRHTLISKNMEQNLFVGSNTNTSAIESFGQAESLTSRLKTILDLYPEGNTIFSELIQNADDAGATKVMIMIDENYFGTESLMDSRMAVLQGPSLVVCNDAKFTEADFRSLARIGQGAKLEKINTTGRFGLGFNSTYHITDVPTFVSGEYLVIFDPHCAYAPGANINQPGLRIKFPGSNLTDTFLDQFAPFNYFGCDCKSSYDGTLFRFPLRNSTLARTSEISKRATDLKDMNSALTDLVILLPELLVFLRSVKCVELYYSHTGSKEPVLLHRATAKISNQVFQNDQMLLQFFDKSKESNETTSRDAFYNRLKSTADAKLPRTFQKVSIAVQNFVDGDESDGSDLLKTVGTDVERLYHYLVASGLCGGEAKRMACDENLRQFKLIPLGSVAAQLYVEEEKVMGVEQLEGKAYCFLPLPVKVRLPVYVNAYWELSSNRRDIWHGGDTTGNAKLRSDWNLCIMKDVIAPLYASLVLKIKESLLYSRAHDFNTNSAVFNQILKVFPCPEPHSPWDNISKQFFDIVKSEELLWSSANGGRFVPMHTGYLLLSDDSKQNTQAIHGITNCANQVDLDAKLEQFLQEEGIPVVTIPVTIGNVLLNYNYSAGKVCPTMVRAHFTANRSRFMQNLKSAADQSSALDKTRFWLQYCFSDVSPANFSDVIGLPFLPLENGLFGCFADPMESDSYFLVTDIERKLLHHAGQCIVAPDEVLGQHVVSCLRHKTFSDYCNVRQLAVVDSLKLINSLFPKSWLSSNVIFVDRNESVITANSDWLASLWSYIIEGKNIELFTEVLPIMPVVSLKLQDSNDSATITTSSGLVKVSSAIPVLHMIHKNATAPLATIGLACLGIFIFDDTVLGSISYSQEVASLLSLPDAKGIMFSLKKVINSHNFNSQQALRSCSAEVIIALQEFILDNVVSKLDNLTDDEKSVLRSIPVWFTHGSQLPTTLDLQSVKLAPRNSNKAILNNGFVSLLRGETDRLLYQKLSIPQATGGEFCMSHLIPLLREHKIEDTAAIDSLAVNILRNLTELESDCPGITQSLREVPMIRSNENKHVCASDLYDPASSILGGILSNDMFPNSQVYRDPTLIILLRVVGLNSTLNGDGIITAAKSIEYEFDRIRQGEDINVNSGSPEQLLNDLIYRAESLLRYLENNIDTIVHDLQQQQYLSNTSTAQEESSSQLVVEWGNKLRYISFIPVYTEKPSRSTAIGSDIVFLPWPQQIHRLPIAAPSQACSLSNLWMCSSTSRISTVDVKNETLLGLLAWDSPPSGRTLTLQLCNVKQEYDRYVNESIGINATSKLSSSMDFVFTMLFKRLNQAFQKETEREVEFWVNALKSKPVIWINSSKRLRAATETVAEASGRFISANRLAFRSLPNINTEPYLFVVSEAMLEYADLLKAIGVRESFQAIDLAHITRYIYEQKRNMSLAPSEIALNAGILKLLYQLVTSGKIVDVENGESSNAVEAEIDEVESEETVTKNVKEESHLFNQVKVSELGKIFIVDENGILSPANALTYDDAPWISTFMNNSKQENKQQQAIRFVHSSIDVKISQLLGCKSLREQLFTGNDIVCPEPVRLKQMTQLETAKDTIVSMIGLADRLGASKIDITCDLREHASESLMHPGLSGAQGPALVFYIDSPVINSEIVSKFLTMAALSMRGDIRSSSEVGTDEVGRIESGNGIVSCFAIGDCLQILSGTELLIYDPCGIFLFSEADKERKASAAKPPGRAQRYKISKTGDESVLRRFPNQFDGFSCVPAEVWDSLQEKSFMNGVAIRIPLRTEKSTISSPYTFYSRNSLQTFVQDIKATYVAAKDFSSGSLLFGNSLWGITFKHHEKNCAVAEIDCEISIADRRRATLLRTVRGQLTADKGWERQGLSKMFKAYSPSKLMYSCKLAFRQCSNWINEIESFDDGMHSKDGSEMFSAIEIVDEWLLASINGAGKVRDVVLQEPFASIKIMPIVTLAMRMPSADEEKKPTEGYYYSSSSISAASGLPYLIEGPFVSNSKLRYADLIQSSGQGQSVKAEPGILQQLGLTAGGDCASMINEATVLTIIEILLPIVLKSVKERIMQQFPSDYLRWKVFYNYWPYCTRLTRSSLHYIRQAKLVEWLAKEPMYLCRNVFLPLDNLVFPVETIGRESDRYIEEHFPVVICPSQVTLDLAECSTKIIPLTPSKLRGFLAKEAQLHANNLATLSDVLLQLLIFCTSDFDRILNEGEFLKRKIYRELANCPLLPTAGSNKVVPFPRGPAEAIAIAPKAIHVLMPELKNHLVHPQVLDGFEYLADPLFKDSLFIMDFSPAFIAAKIFMFLPRSWLDQRAVKWINAEMENTVISAARAIRTADASDSPPSEVLIYSIWNHSAMLEANSASMDKLKAYPLFPVLSEGRKLLINLALLPFVFDLPPTDSQDSHRVHLRRDCDRLVSFKDDSTSNDQSIICQTYAQIKRNLKQTVDDYDWIRKNNQVELVKKFAERYKENNRMEESVQSVSESAGQDQDGFLNPGASVSDGLMNIGRVDVNQNFAVDDEEERNQNHRIIQEDDAAFYDTIFTLGLPILDAGIFESVPAAVRELPVIHMGRKLLRAIYELTKLNIIVASITGHTSPEDDQRLIHPDSLSIAQRALLLLKIYDAHTSNPFGEHELNMLRECKLLSNSHNNAAVAFAECTSGMYWCTQKSVLDNINIPSLQFSNSNTVNEVVQSKPVIVPYDQRLLPVYNLIGIEELTPAAAIKKFVIPTLSTLPPVERLDSILSIGKNWQIYKDDATLLAQLKSVPFIPLWHYEKQYNGQNHLDEVVFPLRKADELFIWTSDELIQTLSGPSLPKYTPPPYLRLPELHAFCKDLGMASELTEESFMRLATDIHTDIVVIERAESVGASASAAVDSTNQSDAKHHLSDRSRMLLRYLLDQDRVSVILQNNSFTKKLGSVRFVPMKFPTVIEDGGQVLYKEGIGSFNQLVSKQQGQLAFTVMPLLEDDLTPPMYYFSALGITTAPKLEVVLRHVRNLTSHGDSLDRWNSKYTITNTFSALYQFLWDNWKDISKAIKDAFMTIPFVPIGHQLIKPNRLFFRLAGEDLSPFMHEIPRHFGTYESFLKSLGVKEAPEVSDYVNFLREIGVESGGNCLNVNELRAVVAILLTVSSQTTDLHEESQRRSISQLFLPDENSIMRSSHVLLYNDDPWLRNKVAERLDIVGYAIVHPSLEESVCKNLEICPLSTVIKEQLLNGSSSKVGAIKNSEEYSKCIRSILLKEEVLCSLLLLCSKQRNNNHNLNMSELSKMLEQIDFVFLAKLQTKMIFEHPKGGLGALDIDDGSAQTGLSFVERLQNDRHTVFVDCSSIIDPVSIELAVSVGLCVIIGLDSTIAPSLSLILSAELKAIASTTSHLELLSISATEQTLSQQKVMNALHIGANTVSNREKLRGSPGEHVIDIDAKYLQLRPLRAFRTSEVVSLQIADGDSGSKYIYAKVTSVGKADELSGIRKIQMKVGEGSKEKLVEKLSTEVYSFKSSVEAESETKSGYASDEGGKLRVPFMKKRQSLSKSGFMNINNGTRMNKDNEGLVKKESGSENTSNDTIGMEEIQLALQSLLNRAGVPISMAQNDMMSKILELENVNKRTVSELESERSQLVQAKKIIEQSDAALKCQICLTNEVSQVVVPCGHTFCENCMNSLQRNRCPNCRGNIQQRIKFYLSDARDN